MVMAAKEADLDKEEADDDEGVGDEEGEGAGWSRDRRDSSGRLEGLSDGSVEVHTMVEA